MAATQTEPSRRKLTLSRDTVRRLGGTTRGVAAAGTTSWPCIQQPTDETVGCITGWCP